MEKDYPTNSFAWFIKNIYPHSFLKRNVVAAPHTYRWAERIENNKRTATLSARKHLKSITIYAFIMWMIYRMDKGDNISWLYMSYNQKMSLYHTTNIKQLIESNPFFVKIKDLTQGNALIDYTWGDGSRFKCMPSGILTFNRGWHGNGVICLTPETKIKTDKGLKKIGDIKKGEKVLTHTNKYRGVADTFKRFIKEKIYVIELDNNKKVRLTGNHRILTKRGWLRADKLEENDEIKSL